MSRLSEIRDVVQKFAEVSKSALKLDVEVVDNEMTWVAGTGRIKKLIGQKILEQGVIRKCMLENKKDIILDSPGNQPECMNCPHYRNCNYGKAVYTVIELEDEVVGIIGFVAMTTVQEGLLTNNKEPMLEFLKKIANLISTKVMEHEIISRITINSKLVNTVIDTLDKGIVIVNKDGVVADVNNFMLKRLDMDKDDVTGMKISDLLPGISTDPEEDHQDRVKYKEINFKSENKSTDFIYSWKNVTVEDYISAAVYMFEDIKDTTRLAYELSEKNSQIGFNEIIGEDPSFIEFKNKVSSIAVNDSTVMLIGETGTGKELFARAIHSLSNRKDKPFVAINCGAIPETLIESELFGYEKGSFTGASTTGKKGKFYIADKGTIFLDEIENMPLYLQIKLLRVLETREIERVGSSRSIPVDIRIIAATNMRIDEMVETGQFREDLFHRLNVVSLFIPPLRERGNDILVLSDYFIDKFKKKFNKNIEGLSNEVRETFMEYSWKGNIRELQNAIEYAVNMENSLYIQKENLPFQMKKVEESGEFKTLDEMEKEHIKKALDRYGWSENGRIKAAKMLGISRATIYRRLSKYELQ
ncbi:Transcriptional regulator containing PAS, AAA-type ATPase, and DNA-binding Fis domains [Dethiosulfatibacter aminovorans DSM 17477]|uniref:Transcriptional regulator containing PAS, AAA-type ATPase, and DNA-binding Fis domains n=1 Tax=Dethiosulfatibacter aminovorans DSM 17477 TaxID=1121476 RepID=A0A1M6IQK2_9FIRM|nr:sigma 54-interacting transcriptional regulator [Dethiosulfatibacter aminovorans]SHJ36619.1 Transcriptional regulator containing PAS, AAA-type ATPase, and DNA-binding Fis domains [Dethiosulfatibacter aminovorans DSM 17477]